MRKKNPELTKTPGTGLPEKHPLEPPPALEPEFSKEELDKIPDEEWEEVPAYGPPEPGDGP